MGSYYGVRSCTGELLAMGGERLQLDGYSEISALCSLIGTWCAIIAATASSRGFT